MKQETPTSLRVQKARTALVLSGVSRLEQLDQWNPKPDLIARDLTELVK